MHGLSVVDGRLHSVRIIRRWARDLTRDLGGPAALSTAQATLVDLSTRTRLILEHLDSHLLTKRSLVQKDGRVLPLVNDRMKVSDTLTRQLLALGLQRQAKTIPALAAYVDEKFSQKPTAESPGG